MHTYIYHIRYIYTYIYRYACFLLFSFGLAVGKDNKLIFSSPFTFNSDRHPSQRPLLPGLALRTPFHTFCHSHAVFSLQSVALIFSFRLHTYPCKYINTWLCVCSFFLFLLLVVICRRPTVRCRAHAVFAYIPKRRIQIYVYGSVVRIFAAQCQWWLCQ